MAWGDGDPIVATPLAAAPVSGSVNPYDTLDDSGAPPVAPGAPTAPTGLTVHSGGAYMPTTQFTSMMNDVFGENGWRDTGDYRSPQRENQLRAEGAATVAPGHTSPHSLGTPNAPGAHDIVVPGMDPLEVASVLRNRGYQFQNLYPEGSAGGQGAHLHIGLMPGQTYQGADNAPPSAPGTPAATQPTWGANDPIAAPSAPTWGANDPVAQPGILGAIESNPVGRVAVDAVSGVIQGVGGLVHSVAEVNDAQARVYQKQMAQNGGWYDPTTGTFNPVTPDMQTEAKKAAPGTVTTDIVSPAVKAITQYGQGLTPWKKSMLGQVATAAGEMSPAMVTSIVDLPAGVGVFYSQGFSEAHDAARAKGADEETATRAGVENGIAQAGIGNLPISHLLAPFLEPVIKTAPLAARIAARTALHSGAAAGQGAATQVASNVVAQQNYDPNTPLLQDVPQSAAQWAVAGGVLHLGGEAFGAGRARLRPSAQPPAAPGEEPALTPMPATDAVRQYVASTQPAPEWGANDPVAGEPANVARETPSTWTPEREAQFQAQFGPQSSAPVDPHLAEVAQDVPLPVIQGAAADVDEYRAAAPKGQTIFQAIRELGGMRVKESDGSLTAGPDVQAALTDVNAPPGMINNRDGMSPEQMQEALADRGWFGPKVGEEALVNAIQQQASGEKVFHPDDETPDVQARRVVLDHEMAEAGVTPDDPAALATSKLAEWRYNIQQQFSPEMEMLRARAQAVDVPHTLETPHDELLADVIERQAIQGEASHGDLDAYERQIHAELTEADLDRLNALASEGTRPEHGESPAAYPLPEGWDAEPGTPEGYSQPFEGAGGGGEGEAQAAGEAVPLSEHVALSVSEAAGFPLFSRPNGDSAEGLRTTPVSRSDPKTEAMIKRVGDVLTKIAPMTESRVHETMKGVGGETLRGASFREDAKHIISWSLESPDAEGTARHEAVHALKTAGMFTHDEWATLAHEAVSDGWLDRYNIPRRYGDLSEEAQIEEAVADRFGEWRRDGLEGFPSIVRDVFNRIRQVLDRVGDVARKTLGMKATAVVVLSRMESGEIGGRTEGAQGDTATKFARADEDRKAKGPHGIINNILGKGAESVGRKLVVVANKTFPDPVAQILDDVKMGLSPMGSGSERAQAGAKDFANALRQSAYQWGKMDEWLSKNFDQESRKRMWSAADEQGVILRRGETPGPNQGLNRLSPRERDTVLALQERADAAFADAKRLGMVNSEGLESYVPRMVVEMTAGGARVVSKASPKQAKRGANLSTTTGQLRQRKYETVEETEAAAKGAFGDKAMVVQDIRTLGLATQRLEQAVAGRSLVEKIKAMSKDADVPLVKDGGPNPDASNYFTIDGHPALTTWAPKMVENEETGAWEPAKDQNGNLVFEGHPMWISKEFEGPLRAVLSSPSTGLVRAAMDLKAKMMSIIMYSPLMHNAVIWGKAIPADPRGVLTLQAYRRGNLARKDPKMMQEAIGAGMDPIGHRYFNQDIAGIAAAEGQDLVAGRSWTSQVLAKIPGLFDPKAGEAVKQAVDKFGDVWHNTFLWDRIADLQAGLYVHIRDGLLAKGVEPMAAQRTAAHFANRYAGAMPMESMSKAARTTANLLLFSRSFTLGNLAAYKDIVAGLPSDVRAQIVQHGGLKALEGVQGVARQKALGMLIMDVALSHVGLILAAGATAWLTHTAFQAPWNNEQGKDNRFLIGYQPDGTAIYGRLPTGKVGEELTDWIGDPRDILLRKLSPYGRLMYEMASNDKGFGQKLYDPYDHTPTGYAKNVGRVAWEAVGGLFPESQLQGAKDMITGGQNRKTAALEALAPLAGLTISKGAPGGPAQADLFAVRDEQQFRWQEARADVVRQIKSGDIPGARERMTALGVAPALQSYYVRTALNPGTRMSARELTDFLAAATPEQRAQFAADREAQNLRSGIASTQ